MRTLPSAPDIPICQGKNALNSTWKLKAFAFFGGVDVRLTTVQAYPTKCDFSFYFIGSYVSSCLALSKLIRYNPIVVRG